MNGLCTFSVSICTERRVFFILSGYTNITVRGSTLKLFDCKVSLPQAEKFAFSARNLFPSFDRNVKFFNKKKRKSENYWTIELWERMSNERRLVGRVWRESGEQDMCAIELALARSEIQRKKRERASRWRHPILKEAARSGLCELRARSSSRALYSQKPRER